MQAGKAVMWAIVLGVLGTCVYFIYMAMAADPGLLVGTAVGEPKDGTMQCEIAVSMLMVKDYVPDENEDGVPDWATWANDHFTLTGADGDTPTFRHVGIKSNMIDDGDLPTMECVLAAPVLVDQEYTLTYQPTLSSPDKWQYVFTPEDRGFRRVRFDKVK